jgi:hypothetical protein
LRLVGLPGHDTGGPAGSRQRIEPLTARGQRRAPTADVECRRFGGGPVGVGRVALVEQLGIAATQRAGQRWTPGQHALQ